MSCVSLSLLLESAGFFSKSAIPILLGKFVCANLTAEFSVFNLLNSSLVIYLPVWSWSVSFFSILLIFILQSDFLTKLLVSVVWIALAFSTHSLYIVSLLTLFSNTPLD